MSKNIHFIVYFLHYSFSRKCCLQLVKKTNCKLFFSACPYSLCQKKSTFNPNFFRWPLCRRVAKHLHGQLCKWEFNLYNLPCEFLATLPQGSHQKFGIKCAFLLTKTVCFCLSTNVTNPSNSSSWRLVLVALEIMDDFADGAPKNGLTDSDIGCFQSVHSFILHSSPKEVHIDPNLSVTPDQVGLKAI